MRIKRIEVIGFKSFCDRTVVSITEPVTSIVGPNGCGKSNIVDAIRWCMGEQSAKHLRGRAMDDVIFAGAEGRGPAAMAEVSLTFEDVGFSHQTLELALGQQASMELPEVDAAGEVEAGAGEVEAGAGEVDAAGEVEAGAGEVDEVEADASASDVASAALVASADSAESALPADDAAAEAVVASDDEQAASGEASAEVERFLADKPAAIDFTKYTEVTVTRRLFRDGTSIYMINKTPCRLRDVTDFFMGTGVGTKAYSIIEQGRIGMIVSARPQDRRALVEEAAGITKFKAKKRAAERRLEKTRQNLLRVSDIVAELAKRMGSLKRQAQKAKRYRRYKTELRDIEMWKASHKYLEMDAQDRVYAANLAETSEELFEVRTQFEQHDVAVVAERAELAVEERRLAGLQEAIYELENHIKLSESKVEFQSREAVALDERVAADGGEIRSLVARREEGSRALSEQRGELEALELEIGSQEGSMAAREDAAGVARQALGGAQRALDEARVELSRAETDRARAESQRESLLLRRQVSEHRLRVVLGEIGDSDGRSKMLEREVGEFDSKLSDLRQVRLDLGSQSESLEARQSELGEIADTCDAEVETLRTELHRRKSRLQSLIEINDKYEGFARGTRAVMQNTAELAGTAAGDEILGLVADVLQVPEQLEVAVEAALGDQLGGILVDSHEVGVKAIRFLKDTAAGRSSFVPSTSSAQARIADSASSAVADVVVASPAGAAIEVEDWTTDAPVHGEGVLGSMVDLVTFDSGFDTVGRKLLGDCVVVDSLDAALRLYESRADKVFVTLDGDVVDRNGVVSGGSRDSQGAGVLAQKREIRQLEEITESLEGDLSNATARLIAARSELSQINRALESLRSETHDGEIAIMGSEKDLTQRRSELEGLRSLLSRLGNEKIELEERLANVTREEDAMRDLDESAALRIEKFAGAEGRLVSEVASNQTSVDELAHAVTELKVRVAQLGEKRASLHAATLQLELAERELSERIDKLDAGITEGVERAAELRQQSSALEDELVVLRKDHRAQAEELDEGRQSYEVRLADLQIAEMTVRELRGKAEELSGEVNALELNRANLRMNRQMLVESIEDRYRVSLRRHLGDYHLRPQISEAEESRLTQLKRLIERMGTDINLTAIDEFAEVSERHEFLSSQLIDLNNAVGQLERAINKINRTSRKLFRETFEAINAKFKEVFPRLFRGGRAELSLSALPGQDILEAGVEIMAQPPGKKNTTVDRLSGGEKALTAVALIFAIFLIKPSPFCLLDEVDAPLDDANVDRYNELIREMTDRSQFLVITHNKRTMEMADHLYGVTMQELGVSKLVSVNLSRVGAESVAA